MLTKDLIRYRIKSNEIHPTFIDTAGKPYQEMAAALLDIFLASPGKRRAHVDEESQEVCEAFPTRLLVARGLCKLLMDRTDFLQPVSEDFIELRSRIFNTSAAFWKAATDISKLQELESQLSKQQEADAAKVRADMYGDLGEFQKVERFRKLSVQQLLDRYNVAQVQGLLLSCRSIDIEIAEPSTESIRQLLKHLRFRQLLAEIGQHNKEALRLRVDGPLNLFFQTQKYGLNLALFFPAILHHARWNISAEVQPKRQKSYQLQLDQNSGLRPWSHQFTSYIPEEVKQFSKAFQAKADDWQIEPASNFLDIGGENYCFPDYQLQHDNGSKVALELFHPWHASHLLKRLKDLIAEDPPLLILGVSRALLKKQEIESALQTSPYFQKWGFLFRDIPSVSKLRKILEEFVA